MEGSSLPGENSEMLPSVRSRRKRSCSKGEISNVSAKKLCTEESNVVPRKEKYDLKALSLAEASFIEELKRNSDLIKLGSMHLLTRTPSASENVTSKRKTRRSITMDTSASRCPILSESSVALDKSQPEENPQNRSGRRKKCTSARVLLGLERPKVKCTAVDIKNVEAGVIGKDVSRRERPSDATSVDSKMAKARSNALHSEALTTALEGLQSAAPLSIEPCGVIKPEWLKPFKLGWRREIVFRNAAKPSSSSKPACDIYYFSADETKLRSLPQIIEYLNATKSTLTGECFTFSKGTIYREPQEIIRSAAFRAGHKSSHPNSNESSIRSLDDTNDDISSQASSTGTARQRRQRNLKLNKINLSPENSIKVEDSFEPAEPIIPILQKKPAEAKVPSMSEVHAASKSTVQRETSLEVEKPVKTEMENKDDLSTEGGNEVDKRKAVRAAATLALRTYMSHALRTVNNPLLQRTADKSKAASRKSAPRIKSPPTKAGIRTSNLSPIEGLAKASVGKTGHRPVSSEKPSPLSRASKIRLKKLVPDQRPADETKVHLQKTSPLKKPTTKISQESPTPLATSTPQEKNCVKVKSTTVANDGQTLLKKFPKPQPEAGSSVKVKTKTTVPQSSLTGKIPPKTDAKLNEKTGMICERRPSSSPFTPKPMENISIATTRICGMDCPGRLGIPPSLNCSVCMCLYHPECAGYTSHACSTPQLDFVCWACQKLNKELESTKYGLTKYKFPNTEVSLPDASAKNLRDKKHSGAAITIRPCSGNAITALEGATDVVALSSRLPRTSGLAAEESELMPQASSEIPLTLFDPMAAVPASVDDSSSHPTAQLLVLPVGIVKHLDLSMPLILLAEERELRVEQDQLKVSSVGLNIRLPLGSLPDSFFQGPEHPLEFNVVSPALSGRQVVSVSPYQWSSSPASSATDQGLSDGKDAGEVAKPDAPVTEDLGASILKELIKETSGCGVDGTSARSKSSSISAEEKDKMEEEATGAAEAGGDVLDATEETTGVSASAGMETKMESVAAEVTEKLPPGPPGGETEGAPLVPTEASTMISMENDDPIVDNATLVPADLITMHTADCGSILANKSRTDRTGMEIDSSVPTIFQESESTEHSEEPQAETTNSELKVASDLDRSVEKLEVASADDGVDQTIRSKSFAELSLYLAKADSETSEVGESESFHTGNRTELNQLPTETDLNDQFKDADDQSNTPQTDETELPVDNNTEGVLSSTGSKEFI